MPPPAAAGGAPASRRRVGLRVKFTLALVATLILLLGATGYAVIEAEKRVLLEQMRSTGAFVHRLIASNFDALSIGDYIGLDVGARELVRGRQLEYLVFVEQDGGVRVPMPEVEEVSDDGTPKYRHVPYRLPPGVARPDTAAFSVQEYDSGGERLFHMAGPVVEPKSGTRLGMVHIGLSRRKVDEAIRNAYLTVAGITIAALVVGAGVTVFLVNNVVRPILALARGATIVGAGDLDHRVAATTRDEVGELTETFNRMVGDLREAQDRRAAQERVEEELRIAREIQSTLIPKEVPKIPGLDIAAFYASAKEVGGDYYDFIHVGEGRLGIIVADVSGKGVPGAFVMAMTRSIMRARAPGHHRPEEVFKEVNASLQPDIRSGMFVTAIYIIVDTIHRKLTTISSSGHNPGFLIHADGSIEEMKTEGMGLGAIEAFLYDEVIEAKDVRLRDGDTVFLYTDGVEEAMNERNEEFGPDRMQEACRAIAGRPAAEAVDEVNRRLAAWRGNAEQNDDITIVVLRVEEQVEEAAKA